MNGETNMEERFSVGSTQYWEQYCERVDEFMISLIHHSACLPQAWSLRTQSSCTRWQLQCCALTQTADQEGAPFLKVWKHLILCNRWWHSVLWKMPATASALWETWKLPTFSSFSLSICDFSSPQEEFILLLLSNTLPIYLSILLFGLSS